MFACHRRQLALLIVLCAATTAHAGLLRDRIRDRPAEHSRDGAAGTSANDLTELGGAGRDMSCQEWARKVARLQRFFGSRNAGPAPDLKDVAYGSDKLETLDVFKPKRATGAPPAPVIVMVHGGGWCVGDKAGAQMTANKVARWVTRGFVFVSVDYPMLNEGSNALAQAGHVAQAAAFVQQHAAQWGGDGGKLILVGHSAGAHLVSLVNADAALRKAHGVRRILGTVSLDAGAIDVLKQMPNVYPFLKQRYHEAFGNTEAEWIAASPFHTLDRSAAPWLGVCSTTRKDDSCGQARAYAAKSNALGIHAAVLPEDMSHAAINKSLGLPGPYTEGVEAFMATLDPDVAALLKRQAEPPADSGAGSNPHHMPPG